MAETSSEFTTTLPEGLSARFRILEKRLWIVETTCAVTVTLTGALLGFLLVFISDRFWNTPTWLRLLASLLSAAVFAIAGALWVKRWVLARRDWRSYANLVQRRYRRLGDRLLGIVELSDPSRRPPFYSAELYHAAIEQVAREAEQYEFREAAPTRLAKLCAITFAAFAIMVAAPWLITPQAALNSLARLAAPLSNLQRYTLVELNDFPRRLVVPHGEEFELTGKIHARSFWKPASALAWFEGQRRIRATPKDGLVRFRMPPQLQRNILHLRAGDAAFAIEVIPTHRPALYSMAANIRFPAYLGYTNATEDVRGGLFSMLEGSAAVFEARATRELSEATLALDDSPAQKLTLDGPRFRTELLPISEQSRLVFSWRDQLGLTNSAPWQLVVQLDKDAPPMVDILGIGRDIAILETEVLPLRAVAQDDYGVKELGLKWEVISGFQLTNQAHRQLFQAQSSTRDSRKMEETFSFSPSLLRVPADSVVEIRARATDFYPDREVVESGVYRIHVLGNEKHAEFVRQKLESLLVQIEEIARAEEKIAAETAELKNSSELESKEAAEKAEALENEQQQAARRLEELAQEGAKTLREALRNPVFPEKTLGEWAKNLQQMQRLARNKMQEAAKSLKKASENAGERQENLAKAEKEEEEIINELQKMQQKVNQGLDDLQALTLAQRLRKLSTGEKQIETALSKIVPETVGLLPDELPRKFQKANESLSTEQSGAQKDSQALMSEISRFYERTQKPNYGEVSKQMSEAKTSEELDRVRNLITENITMEAMQNLALWSDRFSAWAETLDPKKSSSSSASGEGGESPSTDMTEQLVALLRIREGEMNLREQTRLVEKNRPDDPDYVGNSELLASNQRQLMDHLGEVRKTNPFEELNPALDETDGAMQAVENLLSKPQTDDVTMKSEAKTIDLLTDVINLINEQAQRPDSSSSQNAASAEELAFLLQMMMAQGQQQGMGMQPGSSAGGNMSGGDAQPGGLNPSGDPRGAAGEGRAVNKASGMSGRNVPTEFREALESYFNALEKP